MESIILIGHGSPRKEANNIGHMANILRCICGIESVETAYLQFAEPDLMTALRDAVNKGAKKVIVHPFFLTSGMHVTKDIPEIIDNAKAFYPDVEFILTEPTGIHEKLADVILERINSTKRLKPHEIEDKSFDIISGEIDLSDIPPEQLPVVKRVIHATADFDFKKTLLFHPDAIKTGITAIKTGRDILTDVEMVKAGINKRLLEKWGGRVICNIQNTENPPSPPFSKGGMGGFEPRMQTRAEMGIEMALKENNNIGIIAIGNAPTALLKVIEIFTPPTPPLSKGGPGGVFTHSPILVVGVPVGFVKALESKALLASQSFPFITALGRKGGTPVAVAIVNALLKMAEGGDEK